MPEAAAAPAATPDNFSSMIGSGRSAPASAPSTPAAAPPPAMPHPGTVAAVPETPAQAPQQPPANTNTQAQAALTAEAQPNQQQPATQQPAQPSDPWTEALHGGVTARALIDAVKAGELPPEILDGVRVPVKINGQDRTVSAREAANGYMRISDYTQGKQAVAAAEQQIEQVKAALAQHFGGWDNPETFAQRVDNMGLSGAARQFVTKGWVGADGKPNLDGFMQSMHQLGQFDVFRAAAEHYANSFAQFVDAFPGARKDPRVFEYAKQQFQQREQHEASMWKARLEAEAQADQLKRQAAAQQQQQLLQQRQQPQIDQGIVNQQVANLRDQALQRLGLTGGTPKEQATRLQYFDDNLNALINVAARSGYQRMMVDIIADAAQATAEQLGDRAPDQTQQAAQMLSPRPQGAPTSQVSPGQSGGSPDDFEARFRRR